MQMNYKLTSVWNKRISQEDQQAFNAERDAHLQTLIDAGYTDNLHCADSWIDQDEKLFVVRHFSSQTTAQEFGDFLSSLVAKYNGNIESNTIEQL